MAWRRKERLVDWPSGSRTTGALAEYATEKRMDDTSTLARWNITSFPAEAGLPGLALLLEGRAWEGVTVIYTDEKTAVFHSTNRGNDLPLYLLPVQQTQQIKFKTANAVARGMPKDSKATRA